MSEKPSAERLVEMLGAVADAANGAASAEEAFRVALEEMCDATGWPAGHVYAAGPNGSLTDIGTWHSADDRGEELRRTTAAAPGPGGAAAEALASGRPEWRAFPGGAGSGGVGGICAVPVLAGVGTVAVIELFAEDGTAPADVVLDALHTVGVVAGRIAERAMAADELRRVRAELEAGAAVRPEPAGAPVAAAPVAAPPAFRDAPTGLYTPAYVEEALRVEAARADRERRPVTVIALAADGVRELRGAGDLAAADHVAETVGAFLGGGIRKGDLAARYGDEVVVVMPGVSVGMGRVRTQQLRKAIEELGLTAPDGSVLKASAGFACFPDHGAGETELLDAAREALARAQAEGGGRLEMAKLSLKRWTANR